MRFTIPAPRKMPIGTPTVQDNTQRHALDLISSGRNISGTCGGTCVRGATSARPLIASGKSRPTAKAIAPPRERPTSSGRSSPSARVNAAICLAWPRKVAEASLAGGVTGAWAIDHNHPELAHQSFNHAKRKISGLAAEAVYHHDRGSRTFLPVMDTRAGHLDKLATRRQGFFHAARGPRRENYQPANHGSERSKHPKNERHHPRASARFLTRENCIVPSSTFEKRNSSKSSA